jgi:hypothetical protein
MGTTEKVNLMAGVKFTLLGAELTAGFETTDAGQHIFVHQDVSTPNEGVTIAQLVSDVKTLMGKKPDDTVDGLSTDEIQQKLTALSPSSSQNKKVARRGNLTAFNFDAIRIVLTTVYLDIVKPATGQATVEYAFKVDVIADGLIPADIKFINISRVTLAVWNTTNEKIKKQMALSTDAA